MNLRSQVSIAIALLLAVAATYVILQHRQVRTRRAACIGQFYQLGQVLKLYALEHDEEYPASWIPVLKYLNDPDERLFIPPWMERHGRDMRYVDEWSHYRLLPNRRRTDPMGYVLGYADDKGGGGYILFVDGRVEWKDQPEFESLKSIPRGEGSPSRIKKPNDE